MILGEICATLAHVAISDRRAGTSSHPAEIPHVSQRRPRRGKYKNHTQIASF
jgi:hypothetical protein